MTEQVSAVSGVARTMLNADFWIDRLTDAHAVLADAQDVQSFNERVYAQIPEHMQCLRAMPDEMPRSSIVAMIEKYFTLQSEIADVDGRSSNDALWRDLIDRCAVAAIAERVELRYALAVQRLNVRSLPTHAHACKKRADYPIIDRFQETHVEPGQPLVIYHESADGQWYFGQLHNYCGWFECSAVAQFAKAAWLEYVDAYEKQPLVITAKRLYIAPRYEHPHRTVLFGMGARLPLWYGATATTTGLQCVHGCYVAAFPMRLADGQGAIVPLLVQCSDDVNAGFLELTRANILVQAFKLQGERYGWGGMYQSWDCSSLVCSVYNCFGLLLPRNCSPDEQRAALKLSCEVDAENIRQQLEKLRSGAVVFADGHVMLYLGACEKDFYVLHSTSGSLDCAGNALNCVLVYNLCAHTPAGILLERINLAGEFI